jgi:hypothetical protein
MRTTILLAILAVASPAIADDDSSHANEVTLGGSTRGLRSHSAEAFTGDDLGGGALMYARELFQLPIPGLGVWAEAGLAWGSSDGTMFQTMTTEIDTFELRAGGRLRYQVLRRLAIGGRLDVGSARASASIVPSSGATLSDARWGALASVAATADIYAIATSRITLGLRVEVGYDQASAVALHAHASSSASSDTILLPMMDASLGHLDLSGPSLAISAIGRF